MIVWCTGSKALRHGLAPCGARCALYGIGTAMPPGSCVRPKRLDMFWPASMEVRDGIDPVVVPEGNPADDGIDPVPVIPYRSRSSSVGSSSSVATYCVEVWLGDVEVGISVGEVAGKFSGRSIRWIQSPD